MSMSDDLDTTAPIIPIAINPTGYYPTCRYSTRDYPTSDDLIAQYHFWPILTRPPELSTWVVSDGFPSLRDDSVFALRLFTYSAVTNVMRLTTEPAPPHRILELGALWASVTETMAVVADDLVLVRD